MFKNPSVYFTSTMVDGVKLSWSCGPISTVTFLSPAALRAWARSTIWMFWFPNFSQWYCFFARSVAEVIGCLLPGSRIGVAVSVGGDGHLTAFS